jgi:hypothetical protein
VLDEDSALVFALGLLAVQACPQGRHHEPGAETRRIGIGIVQGLGLIVVTCRGIYSGGIPALDFEYDKRQKEEKVAVIGARTLQDLAYLGAHVLDLVMDLLKIRPLGRSVIILRGSPRFGWIY